MNSRAMPENRTQKVEKWEEEGLRLLNEGDFRVIDPGPLHAPVREFSIRRGDDLTLFLESKVASDAQSAAIAHVPGTVRFNTDQIHVADSCGRKAVLTGIASCELATTHSAGELRETLQVHCLTLSSGDSANGAYIAEWLENLPSYPFIWPDTIRTVPDAPIRRVEFSQDGVTIFGSDRREGFSRACARLFVAGQQLYVCALGPCNTPSKARRGCIVYVGTPSDLTRKKIRIALSFSLGLYLVELGHTLYDKQWRMISDTVLSAYSIYQRASTMAPTPLVYFTDRGWRYELERRALNRMVNALVSRYESLDLANLSWAYWHACAATVHIAPAQFGAAIEALQRAYIQEHEDTITTKLLPPILWKKVRNAADNAISELDTSDENKRALRDAIGRINRIPQRALLKSVLDEIGIKLAPEENDAWRRRNDAAHGTPIPEGDELLAIMDTKLLNGLFHRMLLRISNATDCYVDYASPNVPVRRLEDPPAPAPIVGSHIRN
jgi:hypothetical protein